MKVFPVLCRMGCFPISASGPLLGAPNAPSPMGVDVPAFPLNVLGFPDFFANDMRDGCSANSVSSVKIKLSNPRA